MPAPPRGPPPTSPRSVRSTRPSPRTAAWAPGFPFVSVGFARDSLDAGRGGAGLRRGRATCVVWEGVFSCLTIGAIGSTLLWVVMACLPGSRLILTYVDRAVLQWASQNP